MGCLYFLGYSTQSKCYRVYNKRSRIIAEIIHVNFDKLQEMALDHDSSSSAPQRQMMFDQDSSNLTPQRSFFQNQASTLGTLPSNTIPNPKGEMKAITTRSGVAYEGPSIPTNPSLKKVVKRETEETTDKEQTNFQGSTAHIQPLVIPIPILEPDVLRTLPKTNIPYPS
ncbi:hypothetical protein Tco_0752551 [Tanacetum coccineum]|uniref:Retroviral polymerase SH3-like domain-containing protein n=1 Tax=Tanacetum coccineum TaxID=301880 RepID=A0ABQ4Z7A4_9ASTR